MENEIHLRLYHSTFHLTSQVTNIK